MNIFQKERKLGYRLVNYNFKLIFYVLALSIIGVFMVKSATINEVPTNLLDTTQKQILGIVVGLIAMVAISLIDHRKLMKFSWLIFIANILILLYVRFSGNTYLGAQRWISLPGFGTIQPSEFSKIAIIICTTAFLNKFAEKINHILYLLLLCLITVPSVFLILNQPDLSTALVVLFTFAMMIFLAGIHKKWVIGVCSALAVVVGLFLFSVYQPGQKLLNTLVEKNVLEDYQLDRVNAYFFPDDNYDLVRQQQTSVMAIGGGQFLGKGLNTSTFESVKNGNFLSEEQSDFIFAVIGEELGFVGCMVIIVLLLLIVLECFRIGGKSREPSGRFIAGGIGISLAFQSFVNIGVSLLVLPNTGTPLPFISAGLSSLLGTYMMIGLILNIGLQRKKYDI